LAASSLNLCYLKKSVIYEQKSEEPLFHTSWFPSDPLIDATVLSNGEWLAPEFANPLELLLLGLVW
jgi:hypothetical protein